jgi:hypothetical protein
MQMSFLESDIEKDNPVWVVEAFIEHLDLRQGGFQIRETKIEGRP